MSVSAASRELIFTESEAGSAAIAIGLGGAAAGAGADAKSVMAGQTLAFVDRSNIDAGGNLDVLAKSIAQVAKSEALGASVSKRTRQSSGRREVVIQQAAPTGVGGEQGL